MYISENSFTMSFRVLVLKKVLVVIIRYEIYHVSNKAKSKFLLRTINVKCHTQNALSNIWTLQNASALQLALQCNFSNMVVNLITTKNLDHFCDYSIRKILL